MLAAKAAAGLIMFLSLLGCDAQEERVISAEGLELRVPNDAHVCAGSVARLVDDIGRIRDFSGFEDPGFPVRLWLGEEFVLSRCRDIENVGGCAWGDAESATAAAASLDVAAHEIAHVIRRQHRLRGPLFFEEGFATLQNRRDGLFAVSVDASRSSLAPTDLLETEWADLQGLSKYDVAAHFLAFLVERHSEPDVAAFLRSPAFDPERANDDELEPALIDAFGADLEELTGRWRSEASDDYAFGQLCPPEILATWDDDEIVRTGVVDCDDSDTRGPRGVNQESFTLEGEVFCFSLDANAEVSVRLEASLEMGMLVDVVDCTAENTGGSEAIHGKWIEAGTDDERLPFAGCTWRVVPQRYIAYDEAETITRVASYELTLRRDPS